MEKNKLSGIERELVLQYLIDGNVPVIITPVSENETDDDEIHSLNSEIYSIVEKGYFHIKDSSGVNYIPIKYGVESSGLIWVAILAFNNFGTIYAELNCSANKTMFYRDIWWQIEATQK